MGKFLVLYNSQMSAAEVMASSTPEEMKAGMDAWMAWGGKVGDALVDFGMPLGSSKYLDGQSVADGSNPASGFSILQADSLEAAAGLLEDHPHLTVAGNTIEVLEFLPMPGMGTE